MQDDTDIGQAKDEFQPSGASEQIDRTIQLLFGIGLKLEYCMQLVSEAPEQARQGIDSSITSLGEVIEELRHMMQDQA